MAKKMIVTPTSPELSEDERKAAAEAMESGRGSEFLVPWPTHIDSKTKQWVTEPKRARLVGFNDQTAAFVGLDKGVEGARIGVGRTLYGKGEHPLKIGNPVPIEEDPRFKAVK